MDKYKDYVSTVLDFMRDNHYSQHSLQLYQKTFDSLGEYLVSNGLYYTPVLGRELLNRGSDIPFGTKGQTLHAAIIQKLNAVYHTVSSRKPYSSLHSGNWRKKRKTMDRRKQKKMKKKRQLPEVEIAGLPFSIWF